MSLRYALGSFVFEFDKIRMGDDVIVTSLSFQHTIFHILNSIEPINFILGTDVQIHKVHLLIRVKVTLTEAEGHRYRSKVTKNELLVISR